MQKLDLRQNLKEIIEKLKTEEYLDYFKNTNQKKGDEYSKSLLNILIKSRDGFVISIQDEKQKKILQQFEADKYFEINFHTEALKLVASNNWDTTMAYYNASRPLIEFHKFHDRLLTSYRLIDNLLFQDVDLKESVSYDNYETAEDMGYISFEIMTDNEINFQSFSTVISNLNLLIDTVTALVSKLDKIEFEDKPKLILADSGSNTVISIKLPKEISKVIAKIMEDAWLYISDNHRYNLKKLNGNIEETLEIISKIKMAEENQIIEHEQAELWKRNIVKPLETILNNNTLTKSKAEEINMKSNQKMLLEASKKYLTEGENIPSNSDM